MNNTTENEIYAGVTRECVVSALMKYWALNRPEEYFYNTKIVMPNIPNNPLRLDRYYGIDNDDIVKFAKIAIKNIPDYESKRAQVKEIVNKIKEEQKKKYTQWALREAKKVIKLAGLKISK